VAASRFAHHGGMESPLAYQAAIHGATSIDEVAAVLRRFFATLSLDEAAGIPSEILSISTFSEKGLLRKTHVVRAVALPHIGPAAERLLASAALKVSVLEMDPAQRRNRRPKWWFGPR
jgi:hypothetical protein